MKPILFATLTLVLAIGMPAHGAPVFTRQPTNQTAFPGGAATFTTVVSGTGPFSYQWQFNGTNLPGGIITPVAGDGYYGYYGDGGQATNAELANPVAVAVDSGGDYYISDENNSRIRRVGTNGIITTVAGNGTDGSGGDGGPATNANISQVLGILADDRGNLFISDSLNRRVRKIGTNGIITTVAGTGTFGYSGDGGAATNAQMGIPAGLAMDGSGNLLIADEGNGTIRRVGTDGIITTVAGTGTLGFSGDGGAATNAELNNPNGLTIDNVGNLFVVDTGNQRVRRVDTNGIITTVAGNGSPGFLGDGGAATNASVNNPFGLAMDGFGNLFIADQSNNRIRRVDPGGITTTFAGSGSTGYSGDGGPATNASINAPQGVAVDAFGNVFITDTKNNRIRKVVNQGPSLTLNDVTTAKAGLYDLVVTSHSGSVTSSIVSLTVALPPLEIMITGRDSLELQLAGPANQSYILQAASSLAAPVNWQPVFTNSADANGHWGFTNSAFSAQRALFYRVTLP